MRPSFFSSGPPYFVTGWEAEAADPETKGDVGGRVGD